MPAIYATTSDFFVLALTPVERWQAARRLDSVFAPQQWVYLVGAAVVLVLIAAYIFFKRRAGRKADSGDNFVEQAAKRGLSSQETRILLYAAKVAGLKDAGTIFTMKKAFDLGAQKLVKEAPSSGMNAQNIRHLAKELGILREKLGFQEPRFIGVTSAAGGPAGSKPDSRTIPQGKTLYVTRRTNRDVDDIEAIVVSNSDEGITVRLPMKVNCLPNEQWQVRYFYGASVWEFDVPVISGEGDILVLGHSEDIRFINRRRFLRVPVNRKAYISSFPFEKQIFADSLSQGGVFGPALVLPQFAEAVLTELAGPGLRIESPLELRVGQRVAVVFELESQHKRPDVNQGDRSSDKPVVGIIESIGVVRHVKATPNGFSVAIELTGLSDTEINELTRATNVAAVKADELSDKEKQTLGVPESVPIESGLP